MGSQDTEPPAASPDARRASDPETLRWGCMTENGRHFPVLGERKFLATLMLLRRRRDLWAIYGRHRLEPRFREEIMIAAAGADSSRQCSFAHREWARAEGLSEEELAALEGLRFAAIDERKWAAFAWAQAYARNDFGIIPADVTANFRHHFDARERADIELAARTMYWLNEMSNSVDAFLDRVKRDLIPGSTRFTEVVALVVYAIIVPILLTWLSFKQRRNPISMFRAMRPFFREFEARGPDTISGPGVRYRATETDGSQSPG